jgi:uncharacterized coiled-coil DUF342 family protein
MTTADTVDLKSDLKKRIAELEKKKMENMARLNNLRRQIQVISGEIVGLDARIDELKRLHDEMKKPQPNDDEVQQ